MRVHQNPKSFTPHTFAAMLSLALALAGCTNVVQTDSIAKFGAGAATAKLQLDTAFQSIDELAAEDELARAAMQSTLNEESVATVIKPGDVQKWDNAFNLIDKYVANLQALLSPTVAKDFSDSLVSLGTELKTVRPQAVPDPGVATAFAEAGRLLIEAKAQHDAQAIAQHADPAIRQVFVTMSNVFGDGPSKGLRGTVRVHWLDRMADKQALFTRTTDNAAKRQVVIDYFVLRDKRDAQDLQLATLRQSLLDLADAHTAMAAGSPLDLTAALAAVKQELDATQALHDQFSALKPQKKEIK
jgi:hypothetical protein